MDLRRIRALTQSARIRQMRADGASITDIINNTGLTEREVLKALGVDNTPATNNRPPRNTPRARKGNK